MTTPPELPPAPSQVLRLRCEGGFVAEVVDGRYLRQRCRSNRCRSPGAVTYHVWDLATGRRWTDLEPITPAGAPPED